MRRTALEAVASWRPRSLPAAAGAFARRVVSKVAPARPERAKALLFAAGHLASFALSVGLPLDEQLLLKDSVIERFIALGAPGGEATRRTLRANLRYLARQLTPEAPVPPALPRGRAKAPYSAAEIASYLALADAQPTRLRRERTVSLICLGAGAGLTGGSLREVRGSDVVCRSGGVLVCRPGRAVPVLSPFCERLLGVAAFFGEHYLVTGRNPDSHNVTNPLITSLSGGSDLPRLDPGRLRSSYLVAMAGHIGLRAFMDAAGITCSQRLGDLVSHLPPASEEEAVALLSGRLR